MAPYLFVHFREKSTADGEQVHFALSKDGFAWEALNGGSPVLTSSMGDEGVRDFTIVRVSDEKFVILATDLSLANCFCGKYGSSWESISRNGSKCLVKWESRDLVNWSEQQMLQLGNEDFGCLWAPDIIKDKASEDYVVHWSSSHSSNNFGYKVIYYSRTKDFATFTPPSRLCHKEDCGIIDSAIYESHGRFYRFVKSEKNPPGVILESGSSILGDQTRVTAFDEEIAKLENPGAYEAPTAYELPDGRWCLMLDFYGCAREKQGYVPFLSDSLESGRFKRADKEFSFPYGLKHGTVLTITNAEYNRLRNHYGA